MKKKKKDLVEPVDRQVFRRETNSCLNGNDKEFECLSAKMVIYVRKRYLDDSFYTLRF